MAETPSSTPSPGRLTVQTPDERDVDAVLALADRAADADGHPPLNDQTRAVLARGGQRWWAVTLDPQTGAPTGAAVLAPEADADGPDVLELVVDPSRRRQGLGGALAAAAAEAARERGTGHVSVWAHGTLPDAARLAERHGLRASRELRRMRVEGGPLAALPGVAVDADVRLRAFEPGRDEQAWIELNADAFAHHPEQGSLTRADLDDRMGQPWFRPEGLILAEDARDGALLGYHWTKVEGDDGEVYAVGVASAAQGRGLGRALTLAGLHHMAALPVTRVDLYVDADNAAAVRLYDSLGFSLVAADTQYRAA